MTDRRLFSETTLWKRTLAPRPDDPNEHARTRLRGAYEAFRRNASILTDQIQKDLPQLTLHNVSHLDALWVVADLIAGPEYPLTPAEAFVFGGAILLHDAGHALATVEGGLPALKRTPEWRDTAVGLLERTTEEIVTEAQISNPEPEVAADILFSVLRARHARTAEKLAFLEISNAASGTRLHILEDSSLRLQYGNLIGQIAASHNWEPEDLVLRLQRRVGAIGGIPSDWIIDPIKLACLLRCADAAQIDQQRAPDFLFALLKLRGISNKHWLAQNKLAQPIRDPDDERAMLYSSTGGYGEADADAWWIAFDLINLVDKELHICDALLRDTGRPVFSVNRVRDANDAARLSSHIKADGWTPVQAEVRVTQAVKVADTLGGTPLYGENPTVPLRELIQNAADAVRARREFESHNSSYRGKILVRLRRTENQGGSFIWLDVEDNGIGMSERVLTGPLLDFGTSFWKTNLLDQEFPGLRGKQFHPAGQYGIGFYSVFLIADQVSIATKRFDQGLNQGKMLLFRDRLRSRPLLLQRLPETFSTNIQTIVSLRLDPKEADDHISRMQHSNSLYAHGTSTLSFSELLSRLTPTLDCDVYCEEFGAPETLVHSEKWYDEDGVHWLESSLATYDSQDKKVKRIVEEAAGRLSLLHAGDRVTGRAAISLKASSGLPSRLDTSLGLISHGGLYAMGGLFGKGYAEYVGVIDSPPQHASRYAMWNTLQGLFRQESARGQWTNDQLAKLSERQVDAALGNFLAFGQVIKGKTFVRRVSRDGQYSHISDVPLIPVEELTLGGAGTDIVFLARPNREGGVVSLVYYNKGQFDELMRIMKSHKLDHVHFSAYADKDWNRIPDDTKGTNFSSLIGAVKSAFSAKGIAVRTSLQQIGVPDKRRAICDALLSISRVDAKLSRGARPN